MPDKYEFATEYILQECGSLSWWWLSKKWKRIAAKRIARIIVNEAIDSHLTKRAADGACTCPLIDDNTMGINPDCVVHGQLSPRR